MTRIRTLKPDLWLSPDFRALSVLGKLGFIALISNADDQGRVRTNATHLGEVFLEAIPSEVQRQLDLMEQRGMIVTYAKTGADYVAVVNFISHQRIDKPTASKLPAPPTHKRRTKRQMELGLLTERSKRIPGALSDHSQRTPAVSRIKEGIKDQGREGIMDLSLSPNGDSPALQPVEDLFQAWAEATGRRRTVLTTARRRKVAERQKEGFTLEELKLVVSVGWQNDPWNERPLHNQFEILLRDASQVETFLKYAREGAPAIEPPMTAAELSARRHLAEAAELRERGE